MPHHPSKPLPRLLTPKERGDGGGRLSDANAEFLNEATVKPQALDLIAPGGAEAQLAP